MLFHKEDIYFDFIAKDRNELFEKMAKIFIQKGYIKQGYLESLKTREDKYPTGLAFNGYNIAIPHTSYELINSQRIVFIKLKEAIKFIEMGTTNVELDVKLVLMLLIQKGDEQVGVLLNLMQLFSDEKCYEKLEQSNSVDEVYEILVNKYSK